MSTPLLDVLPGKVDVRASSLEVYTHDETRLRGRPPQAVVRATCLDDVTTCIAWARRTRTPIIPVGAGTSLEGHLLASGEEVMLDLSEMNAIRRISPFDFTAVVEPGVRRSELAAALRPHGLQFPVDPGADATIGGMASTNASGTTTVAYGGMRANVAALQVVLADGSVRRLGRAVAKTSSGYDLKDLLLGSAGTLGILTEITLRLHPISDATISLRLPFPTVGDAVACAVAIIGSAVPLTRIELLDAASVAALNRWSGTSHPERPALFVEASGSSSAAAGEIGDIVASVARDHAVADPRVARSAGDQRALWADRHNLFLAIKAAHPGAQFLTTDTAVPYSQIATAVESARRSAADLGVDLTVAGHIGDGNVHGVVPYSDDESYERARRFADLVVDHALSVGGTATGEHGIGLTRKRYLPREHGEAHDLMQTIKRTFDPENLRNPGKVVDPPPC